MFKSTIPIIVLFTIVTEFTENTFAKNKEHDQHDHNEVEYLIQNFYIGNSVYNIKHNFSSNQQRRYGAVETVANLKAAYI